MQPAAKKMQYLLLGRHGNTFAPTDKIVWVGAHNDLPLVESGVKQAHNLAQAMLDIYIAPQAIYAGPLQRALSYAQIIQAELNLKNAVQIDNRLNEIDYGQWSGLNDQEIREKFGDQELDQWQNKGIWPASFNSSEKEIIDQIHSFITDTIINQPEKQFTLAITSNGRLKYFLKLVSLLPEKLANQWKVATGQLSLLAFTNGTWEILAWNENPEQVSILLKTKLKALAGKT